MSIDIFRYVGLIMVFFIQAEAIAQSIVLPPVVASIEFTNPLQSTNMSYLIEGNSAAEAYTEAATVAGVECRRIPSGKFMYVGCTRAAVPTAETNLLISITYYGNSANSIWFNYNGIANNYKGADFQKVKTNQWVTTIVSISDGAFNGLMNGGTDFRMGFNGEDNYIKEITVHRGALNPDGQAIPPAPANPILGFLDKSFAGYQIWHKAGNNPADWIHWSYGNVPAPGSHINVHVASFPDLSEYPSSVLYPTNLGNLGNGNPTGLYNSGDAAIINRQMGWLQTAGLDGVAVQRFVGPIGRGITITNESHLTNVKNAAEATGRLFYICYDLNGTDATILNRLKLDWVYEIEQMRALTSSPNYARMPDGRLVVELWGVGYEQATSAQCAGLINFLQSRGCYVIGGTPREWRTNPAAGFTSVFQSLDAISPWTVGAYNDIPGANNYLTNFMVGDKAYCDANGMDYLPVAFAGSANWLSADGTFSQTDREGGRLLWQQVLNAKSIGLTAVYYAMLDEFEESTNLINGAVDYFDIPVNQYFETFSKDGIWTSSDYYLRLAARAARTLRNEIPVSTTIEIPYSNGPIYYRNSLESRYTTFTMNSTSTNRTMKIDPCFYHDAVITNTGVATPSVAIVNEPAYTRNGLYSVKAMGNPSSSTTSSYYYQISETKITVKANMQLSFWKYSLNTLGQYTSVDLVFQSGKRLSALPAYLDNNGNAMTPTIARGTVGSWQKYTCKIGAGELIGDVLTGILIGYDHPATSGTFTAYFDDIIVEDAIVQSPYGGLVWPIPGKIESENYDHGGESISYHDNESANLFNVFRTGEGVDVETTGDVGGGYNLGWIQSGEWLEYSVNVVTAGTYILESRVSSGNAGTYTMHVELDGVTISGPITFNTTGGWQTYQTISVTTTLLTTGNKVMRIVVDAGGFNLNYVNYTLSAPLGISFYSNELEKDLNKKFSIEVFPNPVSSTEFLTVQCNAIGEEVLDIRFVSVLGKIEYRMPITTTEGQLNFPIPVKNLCPGYYQLEISGAEGKKYAQKVFVR